MTCAFKYDNMYSYEQQRRKKKKMNARRMTSPTIVDEMMSGNIPTERDALVLLDIRTRISKALSKMKKCSVEVFDECIAFENYEKNDEPKDFQISFEIKKNGTNEQQIVHLTGMVTERKRV